MGDAGDEGGEKSARWWQREAFAGSSVGTQRQTVALFNDGKRADYRSIRVA